MQPYEIVAAILGVINVALLVRRSIWNYPFGILSVGIYVVVFYWARLYSDALLQVYYVAIQVYGWWNWYYARDTQGLARVETMTNTDRLIAAAVTVVAGLAIGWMFSTYTNAALPWMDASVAAISVTAQYLQSVRKYECWFLWIAVDVVYIGIYYQRNLIPTMILYAIFLVLSIFGLLEWRSVLRRSQGKSAPSPA